VCRSPGEVLAAPGISDTWQIIAQEVAFEEKLRVQRTWLFGIAQRRPALVLNFARGTGPLDASFLVGTQFIGELCYFPQWRACSGKSTSVRTSHRDACRT